MKQLKLTLVLTVLMSMVGLQAFAAWDTSTKVQMGDLYYYLDNANNQAQVTSRANLKPYTGNITIPSSFTYNDTNYSVTSIGEDAFRNCSGLTSVTIPNSVTTIGQYAFYGCSGLTSVTIPNSVTSIGIEAFYGCSGLTSVTIPNSVTSIGYGAFNGCSGLTSVSIGNSVGFIDYYAFRNCTGLTSVIIPNSVTTIRNQAFYGCSSLTSVTLNSNAIVSKAYMLVGSNSENMVSVFGDQVEEYIIGNSVTSIGKLAFYGCSGLTSVTIPNSVTTIGQYAFEGCSGLTSVTIPNSVEGIGQYAFYGCSKLTSVTIPNSVTYIDQYAFYGCSGLTQLSVETENTEYDSRGNCNAIIETASNTLLYGCNNTVIPNSVTSIGNSAFYRCSGLTSINIPNSVTSIGDEAFCYCSGLTSVTIPNSVTSIGDWAFFGCSGLTSIDIPNSVTSIGRRSFSGCSSLTSVTIPNSVTTIGQYAFEGCSGLTSITIPNSVTTIGQYAFEGCSGLTSITIPNSVTSIGQYAFKECSGLHSVTIPNSVTSIGESAFYNCCLTSVTVDINSPLTVTAYTFTHRAYATLYVPAGCKSAYEAADYWKDFKEIIEMADPNIVFADANVKALCVANWDTDGDGELSYDEATAVTSLGSVFQNNTTITSFDELQYFTGLTSIGNSAFANCSGLTSITIPNSVTSIGTSAFNSCSDLSSITIPNSVTSIDSYAFRRCTGLNSITFPNSVTSIGESAFAECSGLTSVTIPNSVTSIGNTAFRYCSGLTSVTIGSGVTSISAYAFYLCNLSSITVDGENPTLDSRNNCNAVINSSTNELVLGCKNTIIPNTVTSIYGGAFAGCTGLTSITIPSSVTSIGNEAFSSCTGLTTITIPSSVTTIGASVFSGCSSMTSIKVMHDTPISIWVVSLNSLYSQATLYVPAGSKSAYEAADNWKEFGTIEEMDPESVTITLNSLGKGTYCSEYPLDFTGVSGIAAYIICGFKPSAGNLSTLRVYEVPEETGLYVVGTPGSTYNIPVAPTDFYYTSMMKGVTVATVIPATEDGYTNYVLSGDGHGGVIFKRANNNSSPANRAYVQIPSSTAGAREFLGIELDDDSTTGLDGVITSDTEEAEGDYYNLSGQKVQTPRKGLYIKNGKKIFIH